MKAIPKDVLVRDCQLMKKYQLGKSLIPQKYRAFIGLAVAANLKCPYCTLVHTGMATGYGASGDEISEVAFLASLTARWSAMLHALRYDYDTFVKELQEIGEYGKKAKK